MAEADTQTSPTLISVMISALVPAFFGLIFWGISAYFLWRIGLFINPVSADTAFGTAIAVGFSVGAGSFWLLWKYHFEP